MWVQLTTLGSDLTGRSRPNVFSGFSSSSSSFIYGYLISFDTLGPTDSSTYGADGVSITSGYFGSLTAFGYSTGGGSGMLFNPCSKTYSFHLPAFYVKFKLNIYLKGHSRQELSKNSTHNNFLYTICCGFPGFSDNIVASCTTKILE